MKLPRLPFVALALCFCLQLAPSNVLRAEDPVPVIENGDLSKGMEGWDIAFAQELKDIVKSEVVADGYDGKPALKVEVGDTDLNEPWRGRVTVKTHLEPGASYTVRVFLKCEPDDARVELTAWGRHTQGTGNKDTQMLGDRQTVAPTQAWEEFTYQFNASDQSFDMSGISFSNLCRPGMTFWFANLTVTKD